MPISPASLGEALATAFIFLSVIGLIFYALVLAGLVAGWRALRKNQRVKAALFITAALLPFANYAAVALVNLDAKNQHAAQLAAMASATPPLVHKVPVIALRGYGLKNAHKSLVAAGVATATVLTRGGRHPTQQTYVQRRDPACLSEAATNAYTNGDLLLSAMARQAFLTCAIEKPGASPPPDMVIYSANAAPHRYRGLACMALSDTDHMEVHRIDTNTGTEHLLAATLGPRQWQVLFPPILINPAALLTLSSSPWWCESDWTPLTSDQERQGRVRNTEFDLVAEAQGYRTPDDFPYGATEADVIAALRAFDHAGKRASTPEALAIVALLGQWPSSPVLAAAVSAPPPGSAIVEWALRQLEKAREDERRRAFLPHLASHLDSFELACAQYTSRYDVETCKNRVAAVRVRLATVDAAASTQ